MTLAGPNTRTTVSSAVTARMRSTCGDPGAAPSGPGAEPGLADRSALRWEARLMNQPGPDACPAGVPNPRREWRWRSSPMGSYVANSRFPAWWLLWGAVDFQAVAARAAPPRVRPMSARAAQPSRFRDADMPAPCHRPGPRSAAAAPPQQVHRNRGWRLDETLGVQPGVEQGVEEGGQLAVRRAYPDPDALGIVVW